MPKKTYEFKESERFVVRNYLSRKFSLIDKAHFYPSIKTHDKAYDDFQRASRKAETLQQWIEQYLDNDQRKQLLGAVRQYRCRQKARRGKFEKKKKSIVITYEAWSYLTTISKHDKVTLSEVIEKYLNKQYMKVIRES